MKDITIRSATIEDIEAIYDFIYQLAVEVDGVDAMNITIEELTKALDNQHYQAQLAVDESGSALGMALYFFTYSTWKGRVIYLEDFVVDKGCRDRGIGQALFKSIHEIGKREGCKIMKWQVLADNVKGLNFYKKFDAEINRDLYTAQMPI